MTPKEKANELYEAFFYAIPSISDEGITEHNTAKKCALIMVDEILDNNCGSTTDFGVDAEDDELYMDEYFWMEVKQELVKL